MPHKARTAAFAFLAIGALSLTACGGDDSAASDDAGSEFNLVSEGTLTVCSDIPYVPFEYEENGEYTGFDMDIVKEIASGLGLELAVQDAGFEGIASGTVLAANQCDLSASAITITEERQEAMGFAEPYYDSLQSLLVPVDSDIKSIEDLDGKKLGVQGNTTGETYARDNATGAEIFAYPSDAELFPAIQSGNVDAVLQDLPVNIGHTEDGDFTIAEEYETDESYGFAMDKDNTALVSAVNEQLTEMRDNGKYQEIYDKYFTE
ncbi:transporter substrate-binding domain-containing protein [Arthrobacter zhangbolii]|uniref:Transporter substrate-binding domain-containing protein n=1 Tax=Arthrobacter zhangbolii TaxID=2886936 RepID=A0A9X1S9J0_9MICC|nr:MULTISPECIES: transporter substrate-binding domain-containing protein [Arthrobacter]MCC3272591.1 transporter substrate-binding domain-containing protein [Arthrobacter zhangbolii]MCC3293928.1 transporter substrate-binding domain-containing protein [Arthrobacter zhangbolii]MDN3903654.1 transporter substrate-binding domain-containing protein [Arthrobacter sp. YD2]UON91561.1 transporter substrate-binding domain-containing protein [Arthrobacter zhangbolii]